MAQDIYIALNFNRYNCPIKIFDKSEQCLYVQQIVEEYFSYLDVLWQQSSTGYETYHQKR